MPGPGGGTGETPKLHQQVIGDHAKTEPDRVRPGLATGDPLQPDAVLEVLDQVLGLPALVVPVYDVLGGLLLWRPVGGDDVVDIRGVPGSSKSASWRRSLRLQTIRKAAFVFAMVCTASASS